MIANFAGFDSLPRRQTILGKLGNNIKIALDKRRYI